MKGWQWREKQKMRHLAQLASWVTAPHLKNPISPSSLLKEDKKKQKKTTPEETQNVLTGLMKDLGEVGGIYGDNG